MTPLAFDYSFGGHHDGHSQEKRDDWNPVYYHKSDVLDSIGRRPAATQ